jgi:hypothetical protein
MVAVEVEVADPPHHFLQDEDTIRVIEGTASRRHDSMF